MMPDWYYDLMDRLGALVLTVFVLIFALCPTYAIVWVWHLPDPWVWKLVMIFGLLTVQALFALLALVFMVIFWHFVLTMHPSRFARAMGPHRTP